MRGKPGEVKVLKFIYFSFLVLRICAIQCNTLCLARGRVKKLRDEVSPVARFVREHAALEDRIMYLRWSASDEVEGAPRGI